MNIVDIGDTRGLELQVTAGEQALDRILGPNWPDRINTRMLDLSTCGSCVLGQLYGHYDHGIAALHVAGVNTADLGFTSLCGNYPRLTRIWRERLENRQSDSEIARYA